MKFKIQILTDLKILLNHFDVSGWFVIIYKLGLSLYKVTPKVTLFYFGFSF